MTDVIAILEIWIADSRTMEEVDVKINLINSALTKFRETKEKHLKGER